MKSSVIKLISLVLCLVFVFALFGCDEEIGNNDPAAQTTTGGTTDSTTGSTTAATTTGDGSTDLPITKEGWAAMLKDETFENVTFELNIPTGDLSPAKVICLLDGNNVMIGENGYDYLEPMDPDEVQDLRNMFIKTVVAMLENFEDFEKQEDGAYVNVDDVIIYEINVTGIDATISASNVTLSLDDNNKVADISCHMKQEFTGGEFEFDVEFKFYDYGTTVLPEVSGN